MRTALAIVCLILCSCSSELPDKNKLIDKYYEGFVDQLRQEKLDECREDVLAEAQTQIDSLIDTWVNAELFDTIRFPSKPFKPVKPEAIINKFDKFPIDSTVIDSL